jgi:hypothetical protein
MNDVLPPLAAGAVAPALARARGAPAMARYLFSGGAYIGLGVFTAFSGTRSR